MQNQSFAEHVLISIVSTSQRIPASIMEPHVTFDDVICDPVPVIKKSILK